VFRIIHLKCEEGVKVILNFILNYLLLNYLSIFLLFVKGFLAALGMYLSYKGLASGHNPIYRYTFWTFLLMLLTQVIPILQTLISYYYPKVWMFMVYPSILASIFAIAVLVLGCYVALKKDNNV